MQIKIIIINITLSLCSKILICILGKDISDIYYKKFAITIGYHYFFNFVKVYITVNREKKIFKGILL